VVLLVGAQVFDDLVDALGQERNLYLG